MDHCTCSPKRIGPHQPDCAVKKIEPGLNERSKQIRRDTIALSKANGGYHYGGCFSAVEILIALYDHVLTDDDRFILSKGHACWPYYVLLREKGLNPKLTSHPSRDPHNGIHCTTGSLGHGLPLGIGMAMAKKAKGEAGQVFVLMGDGECQEGTTWESLLIAGKQKLDNLVVIVDKNKIQGSGFTNKILPIKVLGSVAVGSDWDFSIVDGHDTDVLKNTLNGNSQIDVTSLHAGPDREFAAGMRIPKDKPQLIIANTIKGKGVSFMEDDPAWHACWPNLKQEAQALEELA